MKKGKGRKNFEVKGGKLIVTEEQEYNFDGAKDTEEVKNQIDQELKNIVKQVKALKAKAENLKEIRNQLN